MLLSQQLSAGVGVDTQEAVRLINREKGVLIDVSESADFAKGHVAGARNVSVADLASSKDMPSNKSLPIVLVCADGGRSSRAVNAFKKAGYEKTVALRGGLKAWKDANLPLDKKAA
jgi:rhodanese-related sulfurtransferase